MIKKRIMFPTIGEGIAFEVAFDLEGWWITHRDLTDKVRTYFLFGPTRLVHKVGEVWSFYCLCLKVSLAFIKESK